MGEIVSLRPLSLRTTALGCCSPPMAHLNVCFVMATTMMFKVMIISSNAHSLPNSSRVGFLVFVRGTPLRTTRSGSAEKSAFKRELESSSSGNLLNLSHTRFRSDQMCAARRSAPSGATNSAMAPARSSSTRSLALNLSMSNNTPSASPRTANLPCDVASIGTQELSAVKSVNASSLARRITTACLD